MITGVIAQWKGKSWSWSGSFPEEGTYHWLNAIAAGPHGVAFAVGINISGAGPATGNSTTVVVHWNGRAWS